ncbi:helix-turn-helix transcriptional regulator [Cumulibacter manganitolerans]|uniref:helix-turn-helix transcriptional regulator n=1 Tax=Cumulibacter manganitolerans TaxID=1884992 RepID=UPI0012965B68|nr:WYL domain-containing protein [Cumulibacter manganitolerans]
MGGIGNQREQLRRMSLLVPFLLTHPGTPLGDLASELGTTPAQIRRDLDTLSYCGLPGQGMGDLIEVVYDGDRVSITENAGMVRPLQLTAAEASSLVIALRALAQSPGTVSHDAILSALAKLEGAVGSRVASPVTVEAEPASESAELLRAALGAERAVRIDYWTASRDEVGSRVVDPIRLFRVDGVDYLEAWCRRAEAVRTFRLDRIGDLAALDEPLQRHEAPERDLSEGVYTPSEGDVEVTLELTRAGRWVTEYYDTESVRDRPDGGAEVRLLISPETLDRLVTQLGPDGLASYSDPAVADAAARVAARSRAALERYRGAAS